MNDPLSQLIITKCSFRSKQNLNLRTPKGGKSDIYMHKSLTFAFKKGEGTRWGIYTWEKSKYCRVDINDCCARETPINTVTKKSDVERLL